MEIRDAEVADCERIATIYNEIVRASTAIYNDKTVTVDDRIAWWEERKRQRYPILVAVVRGEVMGFASFGGFRSWPGYRFTVECSVHIDASMRGQELGRNLMAELIKRASETGKHMMMAAVDSENAGSLRFLRRLGF